MDLNEMRQLQQSLGNFLTLEGEQLLFARRKHVRVLFVPIVTVFLFYFLFTITGFYVVHAIIPSHIVLFFAISLLLLLVTTSVITKIIIDWFFHLYIITNRKVLDVSYKPFFSKDVSVVSLDQVRCVEITAREQGIFKSVVNIGDVICHFDMLTHEDIFIMSNIASPEQVGVEVSDILNNAIATRPQTPFTPLPMQQSQVPDGTRPGSPAITSSVSKVHYPQRY